MMHLEKSSITEQDEKMDANMIKRFKSRDEKGQALVETILLIPFLFFTFLFLTQFYIASQTSEVVQEKTKSKLMLAIDNWRDLRDKNHVNILPGLAIDNIPNSLDRYLSPGSNERLVYKNTKAVNRRIGPASNGKEKLKIETKAGICRTVNCN